MLARKLLLQLADQLGRDLLVALELGDRHRDQDGALAVPGIDLARRGDVQRAQLRLEVARLELQQRVRHALLKLVRLACALGLDDLAEGRHFQRVDLRSDNESRRAFRQLPGDVMFGFGAGSWDGSDECVGHADPATD